MCEVDARGAVEAFDAAALRGEPEFTSEEDLAVFEVRETFFEIGVGSCSTYVRSRSTLFFDFFVDDFDFRGDVAMSSGAAGMLALRLRPLLLFGGLRLLVSIASEARSADKREMTWELE